jgi:hypothetical protein
MNTLQFNTKLSVRGQLLAEIGERSCTKLFKTIGSLPAHPMVQDLQRLKGRDGIVKGILLGHQCREELTGLVSSGVGELELIHPIFSKALKRAKNKQKYKKLHAYLSATNQKS